MTHPHLSPFIAQRLARDTRADLSWTFITQLLSQRAQTQAGKQLIREQEYLTDGEIHLRYRQLQRWCEHLKNHPPLQFKQLPDPTLLTVNPHLDPYESETLIVFRDLFGMWCNLRDFAIDEIAEKAQQTPAEFDFVHRRLQSLFLPNGSWSPTVSPRFAALTKEQTRTQNQIEQQSKMLLGRFASYLSDALIYERNGRKVLAVAINHKGKVHGILQDTSASGQSAFIEPESLVPLQNRLVEVGTEMREELLRIRKEVTEAIITTSGVDHVIAALADCDRLQALALVARETLSVFVQPNDQGLLRLIQARHPFLDQSFAELRRIQANHEQQDHRLMVPFDLNMDQQLRGLVISGVNTGGKTVTLKTVGLLAIMANSGFPVPLNEGSAIPRYGHVLADIGDHQSMDQSLSTFASHLANLKAMVEAAGPRCLLLIDEMGSGTDPQEADALCRALLETLVERHAQFICTTHHQVLCTFALNHDYLENGSMAFDTQRLKPSYRFTQGVPGRSHALEIAQKAGLDEALLKRARQLLDDQMVDIQAAIASLQARSKEMQRLKNKLRKQELNLHRKLKEARARETQLNDAQQALTEQTTERVKKKVQQAEHQLRTVIAQIQSRKQQREAVAAFAQVKRELGVEDRPQASDQELRESGLPPSEWSKGDLIFLRGFGRQGRLIGIDRRGVRVDCGGLTLTAKTQDAVHLKPEVVEPAVIRQDLQLGTETQGVDVKLIGMRVEEALIEVDHSIDRALSRGVPYLVFIHGHGTGRLKQALREHLRIHPAASTWEVQLNPDNDGQTEMRFV